jgi:hypothetical protein
MTEKLPDSQSKDLKPDEQQQAAPPSETTASPVQPEGGTPAAKAVETPLSPGQGGESDATRPPASPASQAKPETPVSSGEKKADEARAAAGAASQAKPETSGETTEKKAETGASPVPPPKRDIKSTNIDDDGDDTVSNKPDEPEKKAAQEDSTDGTNKIPRDVIAAVKQGPSPAAAPVKPVPPAESTTKAEAPKAPSGSQACPNCGHSNRVGVIFCENCGTNLVTGKQPILGTRDLVKDREEDAGHPLDTKESQAIKSAGSGVFTDDMVLRIEIEGGLSPMLVYPKVEIIFGRRDPSSGNQPDVDLTGYAGYRMGVSRRHAALRLHDNRLDVSDLGSSNGTFLNGQRLGAHQPYQVRDGDEIRLGQMVFKLFFQSSKP